jgi:hypothetical protein
MFTTFTANISDAGPRRAQIQIALADSVEALPAYAPQLIALPIRIQAKFLASLAWQPSMDSPDRVGIDDVATLHPIVQNQLMDPSAFSRSTQDVVSVAR